MIKIEKKFVHLEKCITFASSKQQNEIVPWCNGNTYDFGSYVPSSNLGGITKQREKLIGYKIT